MCGICGLVSQEGINEALLRNMNNKISYRGPDDEGYYISELGRMNIGFAQKRLSIVDLSQEGHQPMVTDDGTVAIVYNGEVYNHIEIKGKLSSLGYRFTSKCDTEVLLYAYVEWGADFINQLDGMFAIAILDKKSEELLLFRDRMGEKPIYYYTDDYGNFAFASELKPIMEVPFFRKEIDYDSLNLFLAHQYIAAPKSIFKNTFKLEAGHYVIYKQKKLKGGAYWDLVKVHSKRVIENIDLDTCADKLELLIKKSVRNRLMADVPLGSFLSGGIDSSLICAIAQEQMDRPIDTFTIGFAEKEYDEATYAKKIATIIGSNHHEEYCSIEDLKSLIVDIPTYYDEPFADSSQIPTMMVSQMTQGKVKVVLSGDAGDELFCGYNVYSQLLLYRKMRFIAKSIGNLIRINHNGKPNLWRASKILGCKSDADTIIIDYIKINEIIKDLAGKRVNIFDKYNLSPEIDGIGIQEKRMILDMLTYLPEDILSKVDRATMKYSLEARVPLLDHKIVEYSFNIPHKYKFYNGEKKIILKKILSRYIPNEYFERPKKGFGIPLGLWLHGELGSMIDLYLNSQHIQNQGIFDVGGVEMLLHNFRKYDSGILNNLVWSMLMFQMWYEEYM